MQLNKGAKLKQTDFKQIGSLFNNYEKCCIFHFKIGRIDNI